MSHITLSIEGEVIRKVKKIAIDRGTTLTAMVQDYLRAVARRGDWETRRAAEGLVRSFEQCSRPLGVRTWTRDQLHE